jgi:hypothetical protein
MRSQGWDPDGDTNKELMKGSMGLKLEKDFGDVFAKKNDYSRQVAV